MLKIHKQMIVLNIFFYQMDDFKLNFLLRVMVIPQTQITATVAQLVEQRIRNAWVGGSTPLGGSQI